MEVLRELKPGGVRRSVALHCLRLVQFLQKLVPLLVEHLAVAERIEDDVLQRVQLLPHAAALAVHRSDRVARPHAAHSRDLREEDAEAGGARHAQFSVAVEDSDLRADAVRRIGGQLAALEELVRRPVEVVGVRAVEGLGRVGGGAPAAVRRHRLRLARGLVAAERDVVRVPRHQRRRVDDLERDRVRPPLQLHVAAVAIRTAVRLQYPARHPPLARHRHEDVGVGEAAVPFGVPHRIRLVRAEPTVVEAGVEVVQRPVVVLLELKRLPAEVAVGEACHVVVLARDLAHQLVEQPVVLLAQLAVRPAHRLQLEPRRSPPLEAPAVDHAHGEIVDQLQLLVGQVALQRVAHDAVVPLRLHQRAVLVIDQFGRQQGEVLEVVLAATVRLKQDAVSQAAP